MEKPNLLIDPLPETVEVEGREYSVNSDFRTAMLFELLMFDDSVDPKTKIIQTLRLFYPVIPDNLEAATEMILWFYSCGRHKPKSSKDDESNQAQTPQKERCYDFDADAAYIYAAFMDQYGIDLTETDMHWWKFNALFVALKSDNEICRIMEYRSVDLSKIKNKKERARLANLKARFALPSALSTEEKQAVAGAVFAVR